MLEIDLATVFWQILNFLVLVFILGRFLFKPALARMDARAKEIGNALEAAHKDELDASRLKEELSKRLSTVDEETSELVRNARERAGEQAWGILQKAESDAQAIIADAEREAKSQRAKALAESYEQILDTVIDLAGSTLRQATTEAVNTDMIAEFNSNIWRLGQTDRERVESYRTMMADRQPLARVIAPDALSEEQQRNLSDTLSALINRPISLAVEIDPELIAGLRVRLGDAIIDYSLQRQLEDLREDLKGQLARRLQA